MNDLLLEQLREYLVDIIERIDTGRCKSTPAGTSRIISVIQEYTQTDREITKTEAAEYLSISTSTFDRMVKEGKIPRGHKTKRHRTLVWSTSDLDKVL